MKTDFLEAETVAIIRMCDGENRVNPTFLTNLNTALDKVERNPNVQMVITTGEGKFYSNGLDLKWISENSVRKYIAFRNQLKSTFRRILTFPVITVAAINGHAFAAGCMLSMCHDVRVMKSERGWMSLNEVFLKMTLPQWMVAVVRCKIPSGPVEQFLFVFGKRFTGEEAFKELLVNRVVPGDSLLQESVKLGREILGRQTFDRDALKMLKNDVYKGAIDLLNQPEKLPNDGMSKL